ncbi:MAG: GldG family protein [Verrucomicrobia bacterium]|nr:GldG family protein [Verrucomicrobiota bacterium]
MATKPKPSFSPARRFAILLNVVLSAMALLVLVGMANYLSAGYYKRLQLAENSRVELSPQTRKVLQSITNNVDVTLFYDVEMEEELYTLSSELLKEYSLVNPRIKVRTLDYTRFPGDAALFLAKYRLDAMKDRNLILFDSNGQTKIVNQTQLSDYDVNAVLRGDTKEFRRNAFRGEMMFTPAVFTVSYPRNLKAYFLWGHGEHDPDNTSHDYGYAKFAAVLKDENNTDWEKLTLSATNDVPADCQLLIIAGPRSAQFTENELESLDRYLTRGGRMFVLMNNLKHGPASGIEQLLMKWGVEVAENIVLDGENTTSGHDILTTQINPTHPVTKTMFSEGLRVQLVLPRSVTPALDVSRSADAPKAEILAASGTNAVGHFVIKGQGTVDTQEKTGAFGLIAAVEQGGIKGVSAERGSTRIIVIGDSLCLNNQLLDSAANHYFAVFAINWLLAQPSLLLEGLGPRPIKEYKLTMSTAEMRKVRWVLMAGMPGAVLAFGGLVWLRRRS